MKKQNRPTGFIFSLTFLSLWVLNGLVILFSSYLFPHQVVLGTHHVSVFWSLIHVPSSLALVQTLILPLFRIYENRKGLILSPKQWLGAYLVINFVSLWAISRFADQLGMGLASWKTALVLAAVLSLIQSALTTKLES